MRMTDWSPATSPRPAEGAAIVSRAPSEQLLRLLDSSVTASTHMPMYTVPAALPASTEIVSGNARSCFAPNAASGYAPISVSRPLMIGFGDRIARIVVAPDTMVPWLRMANVKVADLPGASVAEAGDTPVNVRSGPGAMTVASKVWAAVSPPGSEAETVIVAEPVASAATATVEPEIETAATEGFDDDAP